MTEKLVKIGLVGFGTVGSGVAKLILEDADSIAAKTASPALTSMQYMRQANKMSGIPRTNGSALLRLLTIGGNTIGTKSTTK